jgi:hypothetical protein
VRRHPLVPAALAVALIALGTAPAARAQYFGRNDVRWEHLQFEVLKTEHFDLHYYPEGKEAAEQAGRLAERWYNRLSRVLGHEFKQRQPIILYASHPQFQQTNTIGGAPGEGTGGVTEAFKRRVVLPVGASLAETDHVLGHELVHAFQYDMTGHGKISQTNYPAALNMPLWFIEGMAEYLSLGPVDPHTAMWIRDAARQEKGLPTIHQLDRTRYFPYRYGQALWAYIGQRFGDKVIGRTLRRLGPRTNDAELVLKEVLGVDSKQLSADWHAAIKASLEPTLVGRKLPETYGAPLITEKEDGGKLNVGPVLTPDGTSLAFLSERELFSVELFLADARTGRVERKLSKTAVDPHLQSIQFIASTGSWDKSGKRYALGAVDKGRPLLLIMDERGRKQQQIPLTTLGEIATPSFSPDGTAVVFSGLAGGFTDLFTYDLKGNVLKRLTEDAFADLQPAWSPDGRTVAFVTDRYSTKLDTLDAGNYRLATLDLAAGTVTPVAGGATGKNINPQWAADGSLYFLSDRSGITNIYRQQMPQGALYQVTDLVTGVSGITSLSPALTVATAAPRLAYSTYDSGNYEIYTIDAAEKLAGWVAPGSETNAAAASLIPGGKETGMVVERLADATEGLATAGDFTHQEYKPKLTIDYVGQPSLGVGTGRYGAFFSGGIAMSFSDMLGNHTLSTAFQADNISGFTDLGGQVGYVNREHRINWGAQVYQVPYVIGQFSNGISTVNGQRAYVEQTLLQRQIERGVTGIAHYPFDSALRLEVSAGVRNIGFDTRLQTQGFDLNSGQLILDEEQELDDSDSLHLYEGTAALVRDTSLFGATSPILGQRFRLDVSPVGGSVRYTGLLADFRQYLMPVRPVTLAARVLHYGRYGGGGQDPRLSPLFVGYANLVRGYDTGSFEAAECGSQPDGSCPAFDRLLGSRILVANLELRAPLAALFGARNLYGPIPVEVGAFFDAGVAWDSGSSPKLFGGERETVRSYGGTARVNLFGYAVLQIDRVKPIDRSGKGAFWTFNLLAGF